MKLSIALVLGFAAATYASCPDSCSGHGTCGSHDKCTCFSRWSGSNCAERQCPYGLSWVVSASGDTNIPAGGSVLGGKHSYTECSSQGTCNTETGECECFPGYEGRGCRRTQCPNACSGHGRCLYNDELGQNYGVVGYQAFDSQYWDAHKTRQCVCDAGYEGIDCSERMCPKGDDPLTECLNSPTRESQDMQQKIEFPSTNAGFATATTFTPGFYTLTFVDNYGGEWTTHPLSLTDSEGVVDQAHCTAIKSALEELPNFAVPNVTSTHHSTDNACVVTFVDPANSGEQPLLVASDQALDHNKADMQPRFVSFQAEDGSGDDVAIDIAAVPLTGNDDYKEHVACSNRGTCDANNGVCSCFAGYTGEACNIQTVFF